MATDPQLDGATQRVTAFNSFSELVQACKNNGYIPTLIPRGPRQHAEDISRVTKALEDMGLKVFKCLNNTRSQ